MRGIWRKTVALVVALAVPAAASAGPAAESVAPGGKGAITAAIERAGREISAARRQEGRSRGRLWTSIALMAGGGVLTTLSVVEIGDDESGPDDGEDLNTSDDGEDEDGWGSKAMLGGGIAAAVLGGVLLLTGKKSGPSLAVKRGGFAVQQTFSF